MMTPISGRKVRAGMQKEKIRCFGGHGCLFVNPPMLTVFSVALALAASLSTPGSVIFCDQLSDDEMCFTFPPNAVSMGAFRA